ncbi:MAG: methyl-accepting chemotaxis protein [Clostridiales Family XIII bacterium]|jgi:methyl-accepting chemotaxis protein|nr:methyl-accepting chemotaxis protein [Clostridiales Family XIII bacterium]
MPNKESFITKMSQGAVRIIVVLALVIIFDIFVIRVLTLGSFADPELWSWIAIIASAVIVVINIITAIIQSRRFIKIVSVPISEIVGAINCLAQGKPAKSIDFHSDDEVGLLANSVNILIDRMHKDIDFFERLKEGDYSHDLPGAHVMGKGDSEDGGDRLKNVIQTMIYNQRILISNLKNVSEQIAEASSEVSGGSQNLASGSNEQAAAIEEFSATVEDLKKHAENNAALAYEVVESIKQYSAIVNTIGTDMKLMTDKMNDISESSMRISSVSDIIENIAFQTNILALNAAVEAARAGHHGRGFAVVADEVRELSSKSATAAREAADLIKSAIENVNIGNKIVEDAASGMAQIEEIAVENEKRMVKLNEVSMGQSLAISEMSSSINQIAQIVQANSALAEESASASQELSAQSRALDSLVSCYTIDTDDALATESIS